ncbi:MAG: BrnA antitoxin family protein [Microvirga sp.]
MPSSAASCTRQSAFAGAGRRWRRTKRKQNVTFRLAPDILNYFRSTGPRWQARVEAILPATMKRERKRA